MQNADQIEVLFRKLHEESASRYEDNRRRAAEDTQRAFHNRSDRADTKLIIPELRIDQSVLAKVTEREKAALNERLESIGKDLGNRKRDHAHDRVRRSILATNPPQASAPIFAVGLMADDLSQFENLAGERGNPWILPSNPAQVNIKVRQVGSGDCLF